MNLNIEDKAYEYILSKDNSIFIYTNSIRGCCAGQKAVDMAPRVEMGEPKDDNSYFRKKRYKDLTIYISKKVDDQKLKNKSLVLKRVWEFSIKLSLSKMVIYILSLNINKNGYKHKKI